jgi:ATP/maltotriose-dependent transcriptional regulator MalT
MQHIAASTLSWSARHQVYELSDAKLREVLRMTSEDPAWFAWLDEMSSFAFHGQNGSYTALARLQQARGNFRAAFASLDTLTRLAQQRHFAAHLVTQGATVRYGRNSNWCRATWRQPFTGQTPVACLPMTTT